MTLLDIATTIPGMLTIVMFTPIVCIFLITLFQDFVEWTSDTIESFRYRPAKPEPQITQSPKGSNVISITTIEAMAHIKNHPAMRFVEKN